MKFKKHFGFFKARLCVRGSVRSRREESLRDEKPGSLDQLAHVHYHLIYDVIECF